MVYRKSYKKRSYRKKPVYRKKGYTKKRSYRKKYSKMTVRSMPLIVPDRLRVKVDYADSVSVSSTYQSASNNGWNLSYWLNNPLQPGSLVTTGLSTNRAANGILEWAAFYNKWVVRASKIVVKFIRTSSGSSYTDQSFQNISIKPADDDDISSNTADTVIQQMTDPYVRYSTLGISDAGTGIRTIKNYITTKKLMGDRYGLGKDQTTAGQVNTIQGNFSGAANGFPSHDMYWLIKLMPLDGVLAASQDANCYLQVKIRYYMELFDRKDTDMQTYV